MIIIKVLYNNVSVNEAQKSQVLQNSQAAQIKTAGDFQKVLENKLGESTRVQFSKHANLRLLSRNIQLSADQMKRLENGMERAKEKGIKDSLVMVDDVALVVNISSKLVITAISGEKDNIFTNIDGAVIV